MKSQRFEIVSVKKRFNLPAMLIGSSFDFLEDAANLNCVAAVPIDVLAERLHASFLRKRSTVQVKFS